MHGRTKQPHLSDTAYDLRKKQRMKQYKQYS